ncbi:MAG: FAD-binding protein, partial [Rectinema sp.]|nr:FAD-binding protein [Rectinema sp.]
GYQKLESRLPCLVTVVKEIASPRLPTLRGKKAARAAEILRWGAADLGLNPEEVGLPGSPTRVTNIFHPRVARDGQRIMARDEEGQDRAVHSVLALLEEKGLLGIDSSSSMEMGEPPQPESVSSSSIVSSSSPAAGAQHTHEREIWTIAEIRSRHVHPISFELLARGRLLADRLRVPLVAVAPVPVLSREDADKLIAHGADIVIGLESASFSPFICEYWSKAIATLARTRNPEIILAAATSSGRTLMPHLAITLSTGLTADCTDLAIEEGTELLLQTRPAIGGNIMATIKTPKHKPQMATVRPHSMRPLAPDFRRCGTLLRIPVSEPESLPIRILSQERETADFQNLEAARIVVSGGKGLKKAEHFRYVRTLAEVLGASVGASREAVDRGWISYPHQVGLSGKTISPELYLCAGISGAIQHLAGIRTAKTIISINSDPDAPIHAVADLAIIGDLFELLPRLTRAIQERKGKR